MDRFKLRKYVIIASGINADSQWSVPATMALNLEKHGRDIAVVDITDVVKRMLGFDLDTFVLINNKAEGSAPRTAFALAERLAGGETHEAPAHP